MRLASRRIATILLLCFLISNGLPALAAGADAKPEQGGSYANVSFDKFVSGPGAFDGKRVCVKGGWVHDKWHYVRNILIPAERINTPFKCEITVERFHPATAVEDFGRMGRQCARNYGRWRHPRIRLADFPSEIDISPELCVIVCGAANAEHQLTEGYYETSISVEKISPCREGARGAPRQRSRATRKPTK